MKFSRPYGTSGEFARRLPSVETLGYFRLSLRDERMHRRFIGDGDRDVATGGLEAAPYTETNVSPKPKTNHREMPNPAKMADTV